MSLLNRIWPWSTIRRLERELEAERQRHSETEKFASACLAYCDQLEPDAHHVRMTGQLWIVRATSTEVFIHHEITVLKPRMSFKVEGFK